MGEKIKILAKGKLLGSDIESFAPNVRAYVFTSKRICIGPEFSYFLTQNWNEYSNVSLDDFIQHSYDILKQNYFVLPNRVKQFLPFMIMNNRLKSYSTQNGIAKALHKMTTYTSLPDETDFAIKILAENYNEFNLEFNLFFKDIIEYLKL